jgi:hypothetical protein
VLQVCLGKHFTGGALFFCNTGVPPFDFKNPLQMAPAFDFHHEVGTAVVHLGRLQHGKRTLRMHSPAAAAAAAAAASQPQIQRSLCAGCEIFVFTLHKKTPSTF